MLTLFFIFFLFFYTLINTPQKRNKQVKLCKKILLHENLQLLQHKWTQFLDRICEEKNQLVKYFQQTEKSFSFTVKNKLFLSKNLINFDVKQSSEAEYLCRSYKTKVSGISNKLVLLPKHILPLCHQLVLNNSIGELFPKAKEGESITDLEYISSIVKKNIERVLRSTGMENRRAIPNDSYDYMEYNDFPPFRNSSPIRNEQPMPKLCPAKPPGGNKSYYKPHNNYQEYYTEDQLWNMQPRRAPNPSYAFQRARQTANQPMSNPHLQSSLTKKSEIPNGILLNQENGIGQEGQRINNSSQLRSNGNQKPRPKSPILNYRLPAYKSTENVMTAFCGGEPMSEREDSQYYLINEEKNELPNYEPDKTAYSDFNNPDDDGNLYKASNEYEYNALGNETYYDPSLREFATLDLRERPNQAYTQQMFNNNDFRNQEATVYDNPQTGYYMYQQSNIPGPSSHEYNLNRVKNPTRNRNIPANRQEIYKHVTEKLNDTFTELKNAGLADKKEESRSVRRTNINTNERYSLKEHPPQGIKKSIPKIQGDYHMDKTEYNKEEEAFINRHYKYQELIDESAKRSALPPRIDKFKLGNQNGLINTHPRFPSYPTQELNNNFQRKFPNESESHDIEPNLYGESGSFVHKHKEFKKNQSIPDCCVDIFNNYRKEKVPLNMLRTE